MTTSLTNEPKKKLAQSEFTKFNKSVFPRGKGISYQAAIDLAAETNAKLVFVDCRDPNEISVSKVKDSLSISEFESRLTEYDKQRVIIVPYCTIGLRSGWYATKAKHHFQFENVYNGNGIVLFSHEMANEVIIVNEEGKETNQIHVYGPRWAQWTSDVYTTVTNSTLQQIAGLPHIVYGFFGYMYHSRFFTR